MGNGTHGQRGIMVNTADGDGDMDDRAHGHNFLNTAWIFTKF